MGQAVHTLDYAPQSSALSNPDRVNVLAITGAPFFATAASVTSLGAITAGTGYRMLPALAFAGGTGSGGLLVATAMKAVGVPTANGSGTGYANGDTITLAGGVVVTVASSSAGVPLTYSLTTPGTSGLNVTNMPANPMPQVSSSGAGVGATVVILWGLLSAQLINSGNYSVVPTGATVTAPDGNGTGAALAAPTLAGNGAPIFVGQTGLSFVSSYAADALPSIPAFVSCPLKRADCFTIALTPILAGSTLAAGTVDINLQG